MVFYSSGPLYKKEPLFHSCAWCIPFCVGNLPLNCSKYIYICIFFSLCCAFLQSKVALLPSESYTVGDLKAEILSLKGLLLNR